MLDTHPFGDDLHALYHDAISQSGHPVHFSVAYVFVQGRARTLHVISEIGQFLITLGIVFECGHDSFHGVEISYSGSGIQQQGSYPVRIVSDDFIGSTIGYAIVLIEFVA